MVRCSWCLPSNIGRWPTSCTQLAIIGPGTSVSAVLIQDLISEVARRDAAGIYAYPRGAILYCVEMAQNPLGNNEMDEEKGIRRSCGADGV